MNQIETLKYIAENGNPIGTPAESDYNNYKSDPTFRKLAIQAAEGGNLIGSPLENEYNQYKDTVNIDSPNINIPSLPTSENENGQTTLEPIINLRKATALPGAAIGGVLGATQGALTDTPNSFGEGFKSVYRQGVNNEGIPGVVANPLNAISFIPLANGGFWSNALIQGVGGGVLNAGSQYMDEGKINPIEVAANVLISGLGGGVAGKLSSNIENKINTYNREMKLRDKVIDNTTNDIHLIKKGIVPSEEFPKKILAGDEYIPPINLRPGKKVDLDVVKKEMATSKYYNAIDPEDISNDAAIDYYVGLHDKLRNAKLNKPTYPTLIDNPYEGINGNTLYQKAKNNIVRGILKYPIKGVNALYPYMPGILNVSRIPGNIAANGLTTGLFGLFDESNSQ